MCGSIYTALTRRVASKLLTMCIAFTLLSKRAKPHCEARQKYPLSFCSEAWPTKWCHYSGDDLLPVSGYRLQVPTLKHCSKWWFTKAVLRRSIGNNSSYIIHTKSHTTGKGFTYWWHTCNALKPACSNIYRGIGSCLPTCELVSFCVVFLLSVSFTIRQHK